jgi:hypothetical protein
MEIIKNPCCLRERKHLSKTLRFKKIVKFLAKEKEKRHPGPRENIERGEYGCRKNIDVA